MSRSTLQYFDPGDKVRIVGNSYTFRHFFNIGQTGTIRRCIRSEHLYQVECDGFEQIVHGNHLEYIAD